MTIARFCHLGWRSNGGDQNRLRVQFSLFSLALALAMAITCGTDSNGSSAGGGGFAQVNETIAVYSIEDIEAIGYKVSKTYDVEGLVGATAAYYGFWQSGGESDPVDFEIRIYPSHEIAVGSGTEQAKEVTGENAVLDRLESSWPEGLTERRRIVGGSGRGGSFPRYSDYVILGNLVALCQGRNPEHSQERCDDLVNALR